MGTFPGTFFISPDLSSTYPITPGDIKDFKDMPLTSLILQGCGKLTGKGGWLRSVVSVASGHHHGFIESQCMVEPSLIHTLSPFTFSSAGNIDALKDIPLTSLDLTNTSLQGM